MKNAGQYAKFIVGAASAVMTSLAPYYGSQRWYVALGAVIGALLVYLVPNSPKG